MTPSRWRLSTPLLSFNPTIPLLIPQEAHKKKRWTKDPIKELSKRTRRRKAKENFRFDLDLEWEHSKKEQFGKAKNQFRKLAKVQLAGEATKKSLLLPKDFHFQSESIASIFARQLERSILQGNLKIFNPLRSNLEE